MVVWPRRSVNRPDEPMNRRIALPVLTLALSALLASETPAFAGSDQHSGEILGIHADNRTLTLRMASAEGKEVFVFYVPEGTPIRHGESGRSLRFEDLEPGTHVTIRSHREGARRSATLITVRKGSGRS